MAKKKKMSTFKKTMLIGALGLAAAGAYIGINDNARKTAMNCAENAYYEAKGMLQNKEVSLEIGTSNGTGDIDEKFIAVIDENRIFYKVNVRGESLDYFKITIDGQLKARAIIERTLDSRFFHVQTPKGIETKKFPIYATEIPITYSGNAGIGSLSKGLHKLVLEGSDIHGNAFRDEAYLRI